ncbi:MAG: hypothetical protein V9E96_10930 [Chitinophagaceae bacterium]
MKNWLIILIQFFAFTNSSWATIVQVGKGKTFTTIVAALQAVKQGDTIYVYEGHYKEKNLIIDKSIYLKGY